MDSDGYFELHSYEIEWQNKLSAKQLEWTSRVPKQFSALILSQSDSALNFPPKWVSTGTTNSIRTNSRHEIKLSAKHLEWTS